METQNWILRFVCPLMLTCAQEPLSLEQLGTRINCPVSLSRCPPFRGWRCTMAKYYSESFGSDSIYPYIKWSTIQASGLEGFYAN